MVMHQSRRKVAPMRSVSRFRPRPTEPLSIVQAILDRMAGATSLDDLLERTTSALHRLMGNASTGVLQLMPGGTLQRRTVQGDRSLLAADIVPISAGPIGAAARTGQTVVVQDVAPGLPRPATAGWDARSELCVPIITRQGLWGVLDQQSQRPNAYPPRLVQVAEVVARQLAITVENTALVDQARDQALLLERRARELAQILTLNSQLRVSMDMDALLQHLADVVRTAMGFQQVVVNLVDVAANRVWVAAMSGVSGEVRELLSNATYAWDTFLGNDPERFRVSQSYFFPAEAGFVPAGVFIIPELDDRAPGEWQPEDILMIPITNHRGEVLGMLSVDNPVDRQRPSLATIQGLEIFAAQAAAAIENARLFARTQEALNELRQAHDRQAQLLEEVRRTQAELIMASKLAAVGTLAAGVAHEFNNLLAGMQGFAELGQSGSIADKDEALAIIRRTCERGVQITRSLLTFARQSQSRREPISVDQIAEGALQLIGWDLARAGVVVVRDYRSTALILADAGQLIQVVLNLLTNARDALYPGGGTVTITTREQDGWVELAVRDTGCGIAEEIRDRIFEPFVTTKGALGGGSVAGTGLGLAVSYGIVQAHGGQLLVESTVGVGSCFTIRLPPGGAVDPAPPPVAAPSLPVPPLRILVVDDDPQVRAVFATLLARAGHSVEQATDGFDAVGWCARERWDLIISDVTMPRLDGPGLIKRLRADGITTPVILVTGRVDREGLASAYASGAVALLDKPFDAATLLKAVAAAVESHAQDG